jgi:hypothetical protein
MEVSRRQCHNVFSAHLVSAILFLNFGSLMIKGDSRQTARKGSLIEQLNSLKREDEMLHNILAVDIWALAKTMDEYQPGFWAAFMKNREQALKRFIDEVVKSKPTDIKRPPFLR